MKQNEVALCQSLTRKKIVLNLSVLGISIIEIRITIFNIFNNLCKFNYFGNAITHAQIYG